MASSSSSASSLGHWQIPGSRISKFETLKINEEGGAGKSDKMPKKRSWGEWWAGQKAGDSTVPKVTNTWDELDVTKVKLRGKKYLEDRVKYPSKDAMYIPIGMESLRSGPVPLTHAAKMVSHLRAYIASFQEPEKQKDGFPEFVVVTWRMPGPPHTAVVSLFKRNKNVPADDPAFTAFRRFLDGDDNTKNALLKFVPSFAVAPVVVTTAIKGLGGLRPVIIAKRLATDFYKGDNYVEISLDIGSSRVASSIRGIVVGAATKMVIDLLFTIEGQSEEQLPERALLAQKYYHFDLDGTTLNMDADGNVETEFANDECTDESDDDDDDESDESNDEEEDDISKSVAGINLE